MKNFLTLGLITSTLLVSATQAQAMTFVVDNFNDTEDANGTELHVNPLLTTDSTTETGISGVLGGNRNSTLTWLDGDAAAQANINQLFVVNSGTANLSNDAAAPNGVTSSLNLTYDGFGTQNFSVFESASIDIEFLESEEFASIGVSFEDNGGNVVTALADGTVGDPLLPSPLVFDASDFSGDAGFSFASVTKVSLDLTGFNSEDVVIDNFRISATQDNPQPTPEPAAILGLLFSVGCGVFSKKKQNA